MNKKTSIVFGLLTLLLIAGIISFGVGWETVGRSALAQDDGPALLGYSQSQQTESSESTEGNNEEKSSSAQTVEGEQSGPMMPEMNPSQESPDAPVKTNVEGPVEEMSDPQITEEQKQPATENEPTKPAEISGDKPAAETQSQPAVPPAAEPSKQKRELSPALVALRDKVRRTLAAYQKMPFNTRQNTADEIINYCSALGCNTEISLFDAGGEKRANGITCLCWNYPCGGYELLTTIDGHISARLGYGAQSRPSQLLAALAFARVQVTYPMRAGDTVRTVADLVESEKGTCRSGRDMSLKLIGLTYYIDEPTWKNDLDEEWSLEKMIKEELAQPVPAASRMGSDRLLGLSYAVYRREKRNLPIEGEYARAKKFVGDFQNYAFSIQNSDGSWGYFLRSKGVNRDAAVGLCSSGHLTEWLALSMSEDRLDDPRLAAGIAYLVNTLSSQRYLNSLPVLSAQEISGAMRGLHALAIYDDRLFKPSDSDEPPAEKKPASATAKREPGVGSSR